MLSMVLSVRFNGQGGGFFFFGENLPAAPVRDEGSVRSPEKDAIAPAVRTAFDTSIIFPGKGKIRELITGTQGVKGLMSAIGIQKIAAGSKYLFRHGAADRKRTRLNSSH